MLPLACSSVCNSLPSAPFFESLLLIEEIAGRRVKFNAHSPGKMSRKKKLLEKLMSGRADKNFSFGDLLQVVANEGWAARNQEGSHQTFSHQVLPTLNFQRGKDGKAKPYQVRQVRDILKMKGEQKNEN